MLSHLRVCAPVLLATVLLVTGCGVPIQEDPAPLQAGPTQAAPSPAPGGKSSVQVYLIAEERLVPMKRTADDTSEGSLLEVLAEGPTALEEANGTTTALVPGRFTVEEVPGQGRSSAPIVVRVPVQFTQIDGGLQLLATAQLVWTVTETRPSAFVRMTFEGDDIELPTDHGLTSGPVRRSDFASVAPTDSPLASPEAQIR